jgi:hypothetical protein
VIDLRAEVEQIQADIASERNRPPVPELDLSNLRTDCPQCIAYILKALPPKSDRVDFNKLSLNIACYLKASGSTLQGALGIANDFIEKYSDSATHNTPEKRKANFESVWKSIASGNGYKFDCSYILGLRLPGTAFECKTCAVKRNEPPAPVMESEQPTPPVDPEPIIEPPSVFQFIHNADILADLRPIEWRIRDILTDYALYYNFGDPGHFKTFIELDRLLCIASGSDYHDHPVKQGTVFYIAGEGQQGIGRRLAAWHIAHKTHAADVPFFVAKVPTQLMDPAALDDVKRAVDAMAKQYGPPAVVHFDTLARNFGGGDENATKDMNAAISNLDKAFGSDFCRGLTHHTGHANKDRARGSMALHGAADGAFRVSLTDSGQIVVECKKLKDAPTPPLMVFNRQEVVLHIGDTEDRSYTLELAAEGDEAIGIVKPKKAAELKGGLQKALEVLRRLHARFDGNLRKGGYSSATPQVSFVDWRTTCMDAGLYKRTDNFRRAAEALLLSKLIKFDESKKFVYLTEMVYENEY